MPGRSLPDAAARLGEKQAQPVVRGRRGCAELHLRTGESAIAALSDSTEGKPGFLAERQILPEVAQRRQLSLCCGSGPEGYDRRSGNRSDDAHIVPARSPTSKP